MSTRGSECQGPFGHLLTADVGKINIVAPQFVEQLVQARRRRIQRQLAGKKRSRLRQTINSNHLDVFHDGCLRRIRRGNHDTPGAVLGCRQRHRQGALNRPRVAIECQFTCHCIAVEPIGIELPTRGQQTQGNRQIKRRCLFRQLCRGQIDHHAILRSDVATIY